MKRYNLSHIMKQAHRQYKYVDKKQGKTFGECLKASWKMYKELVAFKEEEDKRMRSYEKEQSNRFKNLAKATDSKLYNDLSIPAFAYYSNNKKGRFGSHFCND